MRNFLFLTVLTLAPMFAGTASAQQAMSPNKYVKAGTEYVTGDRSLPDPLRPYEGLAKPELAEKATTKETEGCKTLQSWEPSIISLNQWQSNVSMFAARLSRSVVFAVPAKSSCVRVGEPAPLAVMDPATGISVLVGWFLPTAIHGRRPEFAKVEEVILTSAGLLGTDADIAMVTGRTLDGSGFFTTGTYTPRMSGVRMLDRDQMETAIKDGTQIIDVRAKKQFDLSHIKGAVHVPYTTGPRMTMFDPYTNYAKNGDAFDIRRVNQDREKPVVIIGENPTSDGMYRAAVVLRSEGWKKVFVFYEGMGFFTGNQWAPPSSSALVGAPVTALQAIDLLNDKTKGVKLIDVRSTKEFEAGYIPVATSAPYIERDDLRLQRPGINGKILLEYGDTWTPPASIPKTTPILLIADDSRDWRAYKAALVAKHLGYSTIYWVLVGVERWEERVKRVPERYAPYARVRK